RSPMNTASRSGLAIPATQTLPWSRGFKLTHYIAHAPSGARPCAATARDPRRSLRDRDRCKPGGWPTPRGAELGRRDLGPAAEPRGSLGAGRRSGRAKTRVEAGAESANAGRRGLGEAEEGSGAPAARAPDGPPESIDPCVAGGYLRLGNLHIPGNTHWRQRLSFPIFRGLRASGKERWA